MTCAFRLAVRKKLTVAHDLHDVEAVCNQTRGECDRQHSKLPNWYRCFRFGSAPRLPCAIDHSPWSLIVRVTWSAKSQIMGRTLGILAAVSITSRLGDSQGTPLSIALTYGSVTNIIGSVSKGCGAGGDDLDEGIRVFDFVRILLRM